MSGRCGAAVAPRRAAGTWRRLAASCAASVPRGAAALTAACLACGPPPAPPALPLDADDFTLAGVPAGIDSAELRLSFGDPDSIVTSRDPFDADGPMLTWLYDGFEIRFADGPHPTGYMIRSPGERTARGITVGDSARAVLRQYGDPDARLNGGWTWVLEGATGDLRVLDFLIAADTVQRIYIGRALP